MTIETYPAVDAQIIEILRWDTGNPLMLYTAQRIEELKTAATAHLERLEAASQRTLARALHENRVKDECLMEAMEALRYLARYAATLKTEKRALGALAGIKHRLAEPEIEKETG